MYHVLMVAWILTYLEWLESVENFFGCIDFDSEEDKETKLKKSAQVY